MTRFRPKAGTKPDMLLELDDMKRQVECGNVEGLIIVAYGPSGRIMWAESVPPDGPGWLTARGALLLAASHVGSPGEPKDGFPPPPEPEPDDPAPEKPSAPVSPIKE